MPVTFVEAQKLIAGAHAKAGQLDIRVTVAVVDEGGLLIALGRSDGAGLADLAKERPGFFSVADRLVRVPIVPGLGSVLVRRDGKVLGAVGVSGGRPEQDLECAEAGLSSA